MSPALVLVYEGVQVGLMLAAMAVRLTYATQLSQCDAFSAQ